ncbi:MAG: AlpA family phage regulatory protein, partial [Gammaproteobacteria bacterium]|nr:AlpA family phage regulatory protein [Gammaproteobacteria bacterium]
MARDEVEQRVGTSTTSLYRWVRAGRFPQPVRIGPRSVRWTPAKSSVGSRVAHAAPAPLRRPGQSTPLPRVVSLAIRCSASAWNPQALRRGASHALVHLAALHHAAGTEDLR